ncbi:L-pipecolate oxidase [Trametes pubescens]|uniref:L-pipecolate oxidase n=1 Tax=Trametes pubescens TaxID=154538 RepID=A0A1M2V2X3_TRAPU|nr:L-pipecolate oxidase [Trametes pubescens]
MSQTQQVLIVGAGCFGLSTAYHLLKRGYQNITVIDRSPVLPAPDAASTDINKIVRSSYADAFYAHLAREAIADWKDAELWGDTYHESGVYCPLVVGEEYTDKAYENDVAAGARIEHLSGADAIRKVFPPGVSVAVPENARGWLNRDGGWAFASQGITRLMDRVTSLGGKIVPGKAVAEFLKKDGKTTGVRCEDGTVFEADLTVLAVGSWTASAFPELSLQTQCLATGQTVAMIQLTPEEGDQYRDCPVVLNFVTGVYMFPPNQDNIVKLAIHGGGYTQTVENAKSAQVISTPRTITSHGKDGLRIPKAAAQKLRAELAQVYPELAKKPFAATRLCWYTDAPDENWVIGYHPEDSSLVLATAGSGHAYKFLPVVGRLVADAIEGKLPPDVASRFAVNRPHAKDGVVAPELRYQPAEELVVDQLCGPDDLLPVPS